MILHGIEAPNIVHINTLTEHSNDVAEKNKRDIVLANPPFGGHERKEVQQNSNIKTGESAFLFLQHFIRRSHGVSTPRASIGRRSICRANTLLFIRGLM